MPGGSEKMRVDVMDGTIAQLHAEWLKKKQHYEDLLFQYFPPDEERAAASFARVPDDAMAELERRQGAAENARLAYLGALLSQPRE